MINGATPVWEVSQFVSGESLRPLKFGGKVPFAIALRKDGADGGASLSSLTSVYIDEYGSQHLTTPDDLREVYEIDRELARGWGATPGAVTVLDPFASGPMIPVMFPGPDGRSKPTLNRSTLNLHALPVLAGLEALVCGLAPRNPKLRTYLTAAYAKNGEFNPDPKKPDHRPKETHGRWRLKTEGNTQRQMTGRPSTFIAEKANLHDFTAGE